MYIYIHIVDAYTIYTFMNYQLQIFFSRIEYKNQYYDVTFLYYYITNPVYYVTRTPYEHRVIALVDNVYAPVPVNIDTVHSLFPNVSTMHAQKEMASWLSTVQHVIKEPKNR